MPMQKNWYSQADLRHHFCQSIILASICFLLFRCFTAAVFFRSTEWIITLKCNLNETLLNSDFCNVYVCVCVTIHAIYYASIPVWNENMLVAIFSFVYWKKSCQFQTDIVSNSHVFEHCLNSYFHYSPVWLRFIFKSVNNKQKITTCTVFKLIRSSNLTDCWSCRKFRVCLSPAYWSNPRIH